jgi:hypothetical protein
VTIGALLALAAVAIGACVWLIGCLSLAVPLPFPPLPAVLVTLAVGVAGLTAIGSARTPARGILSRAIGPAVLAALMTTAALGTLYHVGAYVRLPADIVGFAESPFVTDVIKLRTGHPLYTPPPDNNSYPYTPGTQILTYAIARAFGADGSIPALRAVQFSYVILACAVATAAAAGLARRLVPRFESVRHVWIAAWFPVLLLISTDPRLGSYTHTLHNDGMGLLVSATGFWIMVTHASRHGAAWPLVAMAVLPAAGFLVKQNLAAWAAVFLAYTALTPTVPWRRVVLLGVAQVAVLTAAILGCLAFFGEAFGAWVFEMLGRKQVSPLRSVAHVLHAGAYVAGGLLAGLALIPRWPRTAFALWSGCAALGIAVGYTSGVSWHPNHFGPIVLIAGCWILVALAAVWPARVPGEPWWTWPLRSSVMIACVTLVLGSFGLVRAPRDPVPPDFFRYVADVEREFADLDASEVLLDTGSWIYLRDGIVMKDRSAPVSVHVGMNQRTIDRRSLAGTIGRIEARTYRRILARQIDTDLSWYDFQDRGSGVKDAILRNYREVRRIPAVRGIGVWWPVHLVSTIVVLEPTDN